jgi:predicted secreted protein
MAKYVGNDLLVSPDGGTTYVTSNLIKSVEINETADVHESSGAGDTAKTYLGGKTDATVRIDAWDDSSASAMRDYFPAGSTVTLKVKPQGHGSTGSAKPYQQMSAIVTGIVLGVPHDGVAPVSIDMQVSGAITETTTTGTS